MKLKLQIDVNAKPFDPNANPDEAQIIWVATEHTTGTTGEGPTPASAITHCLWELGDRFGVDS